MILGTLITIGLSVAAYNGPRGRIILGVWVAFNIALFAIGGPAYD